MRKEATFAAQLAREALETNWLKLEIHPIRNILMAQCRNLESDRRVDKLHPLVLLTSMLTRYFVNDWKT
jgi:hypothetical protein